MPTVNELIKYGETVFDYVENCFNGYKRYRIIRYDDGCSYKLNIHNGNVTCLERIL